MSIATNKLKIKKKTFGGLDPNQVDKVIEQLILENYNQSEQIEHLKQEIKLKDQKEHQLEVKIQVLLEANEEIKQLSMREAALIIDEAKHNSNRIVDEAMNQAKMINQDAIKVRQEANVFKQKVKTMAIGLLEQIDPNI